MSIPRLLGRLTVVLVGTALAAAVGVALFWAIPEFTPLGIVESPLVALFVVGGLVVAGRFAGAILPAHNTAEVEVDSVITRDGSNPGPLPVGGGSVSADDIVEQIERADADSATEALIVKLNTPGGAIVPSEDIRRAAQSFEGPTVAYAEDLAASGGYWIASGCDEFHARENSVVGSIGVIGSRLGRTGLGEKIGVDYRRLVAGEYKDAGAAWREFEERDREYLQGLIDESYDAFVETVAEGREIDEEFVRETEARVYSGRDAVENGLVDSCGPREEMEERLADRIDADELTIEPFEPERGVTDRIGAGARSVARAFGAGVASVFVGDDGKPPIRT